jgi:hypothetical protein
MPLCPSGACIEHATVADRLIDMRTILSVTMLIAGLLAPLSADSPLSLFTSRAAPCVVERPAPQDEPVRETASPGAQQPR